MALSRPIDQIRFADLYHHLVPGFQIPLSPYDMLISRINETADVEVEASNAGPLNVADDRGRYSLFADTSDTEPLTIEVNLKSSHSFILLCRAVQEGIEVLVRQLCVAHSIRLPNREANAEQILLPHFCLLPCL